MPVVKLRQLQHLDLHRVLLLLQRRRVVTRRFELRVALRQFRLAGRSFGRGRFQLRAQAADLPLQGLDLHLPGNEPGVVRIGRVEADRVPGVLVARASDERRAGGQRRACRGDRS